MSTTFTQGPKDHTRPPPPPPYTVEPTGSNYVPGTEIRRSYSSSLRQINNNNRGKDETKFITLMQLGSIIILVLSALSCIIALHRNTKLMEQNLDLLDRQLKMVKNMNAVASSVTNYGRSKRMINPLAECPPCPTEAPVHPIEPHRNPVSVLNEEFGKKAQYIVEWICENPHIHIATLTIDDHAFTGKSWRGKGKNQQSAKQAAAWEAIQNDIQDLIDDVAEEYRPPLYNPNCIGPAPPSN